MTGWKSIIGIPLGSLNVHPTITLNPFKPQLKRSLTDGFSLRFQSYYKSKKTKLANKPRKIFRLHNQHLHQCSVLQLESPKKGNQTSTNPLSDKVMAFN